MDNAQETLERFEKLAGGEGIAEIIESVYREGFSDGQSEAMSTAQQSPFVCWLLSASKARIDALLTKLNGVEG
jgi:hypothetical protein